jgi:hypothetical protein
MSYDSFKATVLSAYIQTELAKLNVFKADCDHKFDKEAKRGQRVKVLTVARPTLSTYVPYGGSMTKEKVITTDFFIDIDQYKDFHYYIDDIDKAQAVEGLMSEIALETTKALAEDEDAFIAKLALKAGYVSAETTIDSDDDAKIAVDNLFVQLWKQNVNATRDKLTLYITPDFYNYFENKIMTIKTDNDALIANGILGTYKGAVVKMSNSIYNDGTDDFCMLKTSKAIAFLDGIDRLKAYEPESGHEEAVKGLNCYGGDMVRPKEAAVCKCKYTA